MTKEELIQTLTDDAEKVHDITMFVATAKIDVTEPRDWDKFLRHVIDLVGAAIIAKADAEVYKHLFNRH